uniref:transcription factor HIVEP3-like n=1 Tax=Myxine glutinosa TaxID=7769 RepID=UPI00358E967C
MYTIPVKKTIYGCQLSQSVSSLSKTLSCSSVQSQPIKSAHTHCCAEHGQTTINLGAEKTSSSPTIPPGTIVVVCPGSHHLTMAESRTENIKKYRIQGTTPAVAFQSVLAPGQHLKPVPPYACSSRTSLWPYLDHSDSPSSSIMCLNPRPTTPVQHDSPFAIGPISAAGKRLLSPASSLDITVEKQQQKRVRDEDSLTEKMAAGSISTMGLDMEPAKSHKPFLIRQSTVESFGALSVDEGLTITSEKTQEQIIEIHGRQVSEESVSKTEGKISEPSSSSSTEDNLLEVTASTGGDGSVTIIAPCLSDEAKILSEGQKSGSIGKVNGSPSSRMHTNTSVSWCYLNSTQPCSLLHEGTGVSSYSHWVIVGSNPNPLGISTCTALSLLHCRPRHDQAYTSAAISPLGRRRLVHSSMWKPPTLQAFPPPKKEEQHRVETPAVAAPRVLQKVSCSPAPGTGRGRPFEGGSEPRGATVWETGHGWGRVLCPVCGTTCHAGGVVRPRSCTAPPPFFSSMQRDFTPGSSGSLCIEEQEHQFSDAEEEKSSEVEGNISAAKYKTSATVPLGDTTVHRRSQEKEGSSSVWCSDNPLPIGPLKVQYHSTCSQPSSGCDISPKAKEEPHSCFILPACCPIKLEPPPVCRSSSPFSSMSTSSQSWPSSGRSAASLPFHVTTPGVVASPEEMQPFQQVSAGPVTEKLATVMQTAVSSGVSDPTVFTETIVSSTFSAEPCTTQDMSVVELPSLPSSPMTPTTPVLEDPKVDPSSDQPHTLSVDASVSHVTDDCSVGTDTNSSVSQSAISSSTQELTGRRVTWRNEPESTLSTPCTSLSHCLEKAVNTASKRSSDVSATAGKSDDKIIESDTMRSPQIKSNRLYSHLPLHSQDPSRKAPPKVSLGGLQLISSLFLPTAQMVPFPVSERGNSQESRQPTKAKESALPMQSRETTGEENVPLLTHSQNQEAEGSPMSTRAPSLSDRQESGERSPMGRDSQQLSLDYHSEEEFPSVWEVPYNWATQSTAMLQEAGTSSTSEAQPRYSSLGLTLGAASAGQEGATSAFVSLPCRVSHELYQATLDVKSSSSTSMQSVGESQFTYQIVHPHGCAGTGPASAFDFQMGSPTQSQPPGAGLLYYVPQTSPSLFPTCGVGGAAYHVPLEPSSINRGPAPGPAFAYKSSATCVVPGRPPPLGVLYQPRQPYGMGTCTTFIPTQSSNTSCTHPPTTAFQAQQASSEMLIPTLLGTAQNVLGIPVVQLIIPASPAVTFIPVQGIVQPISGSLAREQSFLTTQATTLSSGSFFGRPVTCPRCQRVFSSPELLWHHLSSQHSEWRDQPVPQDPVIRTESDRDDKPQTGTPLSAQGPSATPTSCFSFAPTSCS